MKDFNKEYSYYIGTVCPCCHASSEKGHESNGFTGDRASYLCRECHEQWDAESYSQD
jgi:transposase-like protein